MASAPTDQSAAIPSSKYDYQLHDTSPENFNPPLWQVQNGACNLYFSVPTSLEGPVFLYYKMTNYYQNHRRYVKSIDTDQLLGDSVSYSTVDGGNCKPLDVQDGKIIYPCGLIANSVFNGECSLSLNHFNRLCREKISLSLSSLSLSPSHFRTKDLMPPLLPLLSQTSSKIQSW